jgi:hypothetical protein
VIMNLSLSLARLPESIGKLIAADPVTRNWVNEGHRLEFVLTSPEWAAEWLEAEDPVQIEVLSGIVSQFAGLPFEPDSLLRDSERWTTLPGAEIRVAIARLRRSGIIYAVRKTWGDQLLYVPTDCVSLWQSVLFPVENADAVLNREQRIMYSDSPFRLPLSLELLKVWQFIHRHPIVITSKGGLHRPTITRLASEMLLTAEELVGLSLRYPQEESVSAPIALALDLGLVCQVLKMDNERIRTDELGLSSWLEQSVDEADVRLHEWIVSRYASQAAASHLVACAVRSLKPDVWYLSDKLGFKYEQLEALEAWLNILESFGWLERGYAHGRPAFRKKKGASIGIAEDEQTRSGGSLYVQPDGELIVPPDAGLRLRWEIANVADLVKADTLFVYRLTRSSAERAYLLGYSANSLLDLLGQSSEMKVPDQVEQALQDWFSRLGKVSLGEVMLLRADNPEVADELLGDSELCAWLGERVGDKHFVVEASSYPKLRARLQAIGYPPHELARSIPSKLDPFFSEERPDEHVEEERQGWIYQSNTLGMYESDRSIPGKEQLFPGMSDIPQTWISRQGAYHSSTRKELVKKAIEWQASLWVGRPGHELIFTPRRVEETDTDWNVLGLWRTSDYEQRSERPTNSIAVVHAEQLGELRIALPPIGEL